MVKLEIVKPNRLKQGKKWRQISCIKFCANFFNVLEKNFNHLHNNLL